MCWYIEGLCYMYMRATKVKIIYLFLYTARIFHDCVYVKMSTYVHANKNILNHKRKNTLVNYTIVYNIRAYSL